MQYSTNEILLAVYKFQVANESLTTKGGFIEKYCSSITFKFLMNKDVRQIVGIIEQEQLCEIKSELM